MKEVELKEKFEISERKRVEETAKRDAETTDMSKKMEEMHKEMENSRTMMQSFVQQNFFIQQLLSRTSSRRSSHVTTPHVIEASPSSEGSFQDLGRNVERASRRSHVTEAALQNMLQEGARREETMQRIIEESMRRETEANQRCGRDMTQVPQQTSASLHNTPPI